jgi:sulfide:quinone oxidoreductase
VEWKTDMNASTLESSRTPGMAPRITVIGAGFGALSTVRELRRRDTAAEITLVSPRPELHYLPGIIWIPGGLRTREQLVVPLANFFDRLRVRHVAAEVTGLREGGRVVDTTAGEQRNDALVIASGGRFIKKQPGIEHAITPCEGIAAAEQIRDRLKAMAGGVIAVGFAGNPNEPSAVRGGPMFEFLFGIDAQLRREGRRDLFELVFFNPMKEPGNRLGPKAVQYLLAEMGRRGIRTHLGHKMVRFEAGKVVTEGGEFAADLILFMPGMTGNLWFDQTPLARSPGGLLKADAQCRVEGAEHVYVVGDSGSFPGPDWMPKQAHMADLQAAAAAQNLLAGLRGQTPTATFKVELICIIDAIDQGTLVWRTPERNVILPSTRLLHWAKRGFERAYLRKYR